jgi:hypothetical protein
MRARSADWENLPCSRRSLESGLLAALACVPALQVVEDQRHFAQRVDRGIDQVHPPHGLGAEELLQVQLVDFVFVLRAPA